MLGIVGYWRWELWGVGVRSSDVGVRSSVWRSGVFVLGVLVL